MAYRFFEEAPVWQKAMELAVKVFEMTEKLPRKEDYGLTSQIRRSSLSVSGNIADGFGRKHPKDKANFYYDARGPLYETKSHLIYGYKVKYFIKNDFEISIEEINIIGKELNLLINSILR
jgi:four helix bundle protein